jgi:ABC-type multidrug transport system ATPase subunit
MSSWGINSSKASLEANFAGSASVLKLYFFLILFVWMVPSLSLASLLAHLTFLLPLLSSNPEPTSGLDSSTALEIVNAIKAFTLGAPSANGTITKSTVFCTIHQPSPAQFLQFDRLVLLAPGGFLLFSGSIADALQFFTQSLKFDYLASENPAEFFLEVAVGKRFPRGMAGPYDLEVLVAAYNKRRQLDPFVLMSSSDNSSSSFSSSSPSSSTSPSPVYVEKKVDVLSIVRTLIHREWRATIWNGPYMFAQMQAQFLSALIVGIVFFQQAIPAQNADTINKHDGLISDDCYNTLSALFLGLTLATRPNIAAIPEIFASKILYTREAETGAYDAFLYSIAVVVGRIPLLLIKTLLFVTITFFMVGYTLNLQVFLLYYALTALVSWVSLSYAMWLAAYCSTPMVALGLYPPAFSILSFFSGYQIHFSDLPIWFRDWMPWFSYVRYAYEGLVKNEFQHYEDHEEVYKEYDFHDDGLTPGVALLVLFVWVILMTVLFYLSLRPSKTLLRWEATPSLSVVRPSGTTNPLQTGLALEDQSRATHSRFSQSIREGGSTIVRHLVDRNSQPELERSRRTAHNLGSLHSISHLLLSEVSRNTLTELPQEVVQYNDPFTLTRESIARRSSHATSSATASSSPPRQTQNLGSGLQLNFEINSLAVMLPDQTTGALTPKSLLNSIKGTVNAKETVAIMGPSGAGKTTLLDVLSGRLLGTVSKSPSQGEFQLSGSINVISPVTNKYRNAESCIGYVTQQSNLNPYLSVIDTLTFAAEMRMPIGLPSSHCHTRLISPTLSLSLFRYP